MKKILNRRKDIVFLFKQNKAKWVYLPQKLTKTYLPLEADSVQKRYAGFFVVLAPCLLLLAIEFLYLGSVLSIRNEKT